MFYTRARSDDYGRLGVSADFTILAAIACLLIVSPLGVLAARWATPFADPAREPRLVELEFMDRRFAAPDTWLPEAWMAGARRASPEDRITLRIPLSEIVGSGAGPDAVVGVTLTPADAALAPSERPRALYARFLSAEASAAPGGLVKRRFRDGTPYEGEALFVAPPDGRAFSARCPAAPSTGAEIACSAEFRFGAVDAHVQIAMRDIDRWESVAAFVKSLVVGGASR